MITRIEHPSWCHVSSCTVSQSGTGTHVSRTAVLDPDPLNAVHTTLRLIQNPPIPGYPTTGVTMVEILVTIPSYDPEISDEEFSFILSGARAHGLGTLLLAAGREAMS
jgi:hypothetical protein